MEFVQLKAAIGRWQKSEPSVYMALCMTESLFRDIEKAADARIHKCDPGEDDLGSKLLWLSKELNNIFAIVKDEIPWSERLETRRTRVQELSQQLEAMKDTFEEVDRYQKKESELQGTWNELIKKSQDFAELKSRCEILGRDIAQKEQENRDLENTRDFRKRSLDGLKEKYKDLTQQCERLRKEKEELQQRSDDYFRMVLTPVQNAVDGFKKELSDGENEKYRLTNEEKNLRRQIETLRSELKTIEEQISDLQEIQFAAGEEISLLTSQRDQAQFRVQELEDEKQNLTASRDSFNQRAQRLMEENECFKKDQVDPVTQQLADLKATENLLKQKLVDLQQEKTATQQRKDALPQEIEKIRNEITYQKGRNSTLEESLTKLQEEKESEKSRGEALQEETTRLEQNIADFKKAWIEPLRKKIQTLREEQTSLDQQLETVRSEESTLEQALEATKETIRTKNMRISFLDQQIREQEEEQNKLAPVFKEKEERDKTLKAELGQLKQDLEAALSSIEYMTQVQIPETEAILSQTTQNQEDKEKDLTQLQEQIRKQEEFATKSQEELDQKNKEYLALQEKHSLNKEEIARLEHKITELNQLANEGRVTKIMETLNQEISRMEGLISQESELKSDIEEKHKEIQSLEVSLQQRRATKEMAEQKKRELDNRMKELSFVEDPAFAGELEQLDLRLERLDLGHRSLKEALVVLGDHLEQDSPSLTLEFEAEIKDLKKRTERLLQSLIKIANIRLEVRS